MANLMNIIGLTAIFFSCLGLFGLSSYIVERKTKEIGIRKVLGASFGKVLWGVSREFFVLVVLANALAIPAAYFIMRNWLQGYAYRTDLSGSVFLMAMVIALAIAQITVSFQAIRAAIANPADSLRYE